MRDPRRSCGRLQTLNDLPREPETPFVSRRGFLAGAGATLGAAPLAALLRAEDALAAVPPPTVYDVTTYGAQGDGQADDTAPIQAAIEAARSRSGGTIVFPAGTFRITGPLTLYSQIVFRGAGMRATVIRKSSGGPRYPILRSPQSQPLEAIHSFSLQNISLDGNREGGALGHGVDVYAYGYTLFNVSIFGCAERGLWSVYPDDLPADGHPLEAMLANVRVHNCTEGGIYWNGPHDSQWMNVVVFHCGPPGIENGSTSKAVEVGPRGPGLRATNCHVWGLNHAYAWWLNAEAPGLVNCTGEGAERAQVAVLGSDAQIIGGKYFGARDDLQAVAFQIGEIGFPAPAGTFMFTKVVNCDLGALKFVNDNGLGRYSLYVWQTTGKAVVVRAGAHMRPTNRFDLQVAGGAKMGDLAELKPVTYQEDMLARKSFEVRGDLRAGGPGGRVGFLGAIPQARVSGWSASGANRRTLTQDADLASVREVLGTLVRDLKRYGLLGD